MRRMLFIFLFFNICLSQTENRWLLNLGFSYTSFDNSYRLNRSGGMPGYQIGIGREFSFSDHFFIAAGLQYSVKGATLKSRLIYPITDFQTSMDIYEQDIRGKIGFIEIPVYVKYRLKFKYFHLKIYGGINYSIPFRDYTTREKKSLWMPDINPEDYKSSFEYSEWEESGFGNNKAAFIYNFGFEFIRQKTGLNLKYALDGRDVWWFDSISEIYNTMSTFSVSMLFYL